MKQTIKIIIILITLATKLNAQENKEFPIYTVAVNIVPESFDYPLIGFVNLAKGSHSTAHIGFINWNQNNFSGCQLGFINTIGVSLIGTQIGFINTAIDSVKGLQLGFVKVYSSSFFIDSNIYGITLCIYE